MIFRKLAPFFFCALLAAACSKTGAKNTVWVYTSIYPETVSALETAIEAKHPDLDVRWFQNGSENVSAKIALERLSGGVKADLVATADIFWYRRLAAEGFWLPYKPELAYDIPDAYEGPDGSFTTPRLSVMVIGYNKKALGETAPPKSFRELAEAPWRGKVTSGSPLESGSNYALMMNLAYRYGYDFLEALKQNGLMSAGGNSAVMRRIESGERPVGMVLLENLLSESRTNPNLAIVYPEDGSVVIPDPMGIVKTAKNPDGARKVADFLLSIEGQKLLLGGFMHVPHPELGPPGGAPSLAELRGGGFEATDAFFDFARREERSFKKRYAEIMFE